jgi:hypothetical protein
MQDPIIRNMGQIKESCMDKTMKHRPILVAGERKRANPKKIVILIMLVHQSFY